MSKRVPDGWFTKTIGDIGPFYNGLSGKTSKDFGQGEPFLTYLQVFNKTLSVKEQAGLVSVDEGEKQEKVQYEDILFTTSSETPDEVGMAAVFLEKSWSPYLNSFCFGLRPKEEFPLSPEFANHFFRGDKFRDDMRPLAQGSTRFNLSKENLKKLSVILPPPSEQKKIASILTSVDEVAENTQKQIDKLQDLKKATMNELLTKGLGHTEFKDSKLGRIPKSWDVVSLSDLALVDRESLSSSTSPDYQFFYIDITSVKTCFINIPPTKIKYDDSPSRARRVVRKGDVLLSTVRPNLKAFAYVENDCLDWICSTGFSVLSPKDGNGGRFIFYSVLSEFVTKQHYCPNVLRWMYCNHLIAYIKQPLRNASDLNPKSIPT